MPPEQPIAPMSLPSSTKGMPPREAMMPSSVVDVSEAFLHRVFKNLRRPAEFCRSARLVLSNRNRGQLRAVHARKGDETAAGIDDGDVQRPAALVGFGDGRLYGGLGLFQRDRGAIGRIEGHLLGHGVERVCRRRRRLLGIRRAGQRISRSPAAPQSMCKSSLDFLPCMATWSPSLPAGDVSRKAIVCATCSKPG